MYLLGYLGSCWLKGLTYDSYRVGYVCRMNPTKYEPSVSINRVHNVTSEQFLIKSAAIYAILRCTCSLIS